MSSEDPKRPGAGAASEPAFARGRIQWSRPPQQVFRTGPLPRAGTGSPFVATPRPGAGILSGSMVPPPRATEPEVAPLQEPEVEPVVAQPLQPVPEIEAEFEEAEVEAPEVEAVVEPEPEPEPVVQAAKPARGPAWRPVEIVADVHEPEPAETVTPPLSGEAQPKAAPRSLPSVVVTPAIYATVSAAIERVTKKDRWILVVAVLAVVVTGGFIWLATLPGGGGAPVDIDAPPPVADGLTVEVVEPTVSTEPVGAVAPERTTPLETRTVTPAPTSAAPVQAAPAPRAAAPVVTPSAPATQPRPYIETAPPVVDPPTAAQPAPSDPDAPIATRPQPLD